MANGKEKLVNDISGLLIEAQNGEFGDFINTKYASPKSELVNQLMFLIKNTQNGLYDD